jgi:hypothetical protein
MAEESGAPAGADDGGAPPAETGGTPPAETGGTPERPEYVPEKFWNAETGEIRMEDAFKSYAEIETNGRIRRDKLRAEVAAEIELDRMASRPDDVNGYELKVPDAIAEHFEEGMEFQFDESDPLLGFWKETAFELGMDQEGFEKGVSAYIQAQLSAMPDLEAEIGKLGENGKDRIEHVENWAKTALSNDAYEAIRNFAVTAENITALEEVMRLANEPAFMPPGGDVPDALNLATLQQMQMDKRYHDPAHYDPVFVEKVNQGFARLYPD